ncbi:hypothetical protein KSS87_007947 [Heliosperma pusillum]|nr:hypothetical protein KSS87_007947 [Heliosperma pusillum]
MAESHRRRYSRSPSPPKARSRSLSRSISKSRSPSPPRYKSRSRSRSRSASRGREEVGNPGNTLFVTGLSARVTERDLKDHFGKEGKVSSVFLVMEPRTRISRGFAFVTMDCLEDADRCIKYLNQSVLEGRYITVEKALVADLVGVMDVMIIVIEDLQGVHLIEVVVVILLGVHRMLKGQEGTDQGLILHMEVLTVDMGAVLAMSDKKALYALRILVLTSMNYRVSIDRRLQFYASEVI